jgi:hypothetical protein
MRFSGFCDGMLNLATVLLSFGFANQLRYKKRRLGFKERIMESDTKKRPRTSKKRWRTWTEKWRNQIPKTDLGIKKI